MKTGKDIQMKYKFETGKYPPDLSSAKGYAPDPLVEFIDEAEDYIAWLENELLTKE